jgi:hypothetical protein
MEKKPSPQVRPMAQVSLRTLQVSLRTLQVMLRLRLFSCSNVTERSLSIVVMTMAKMVLLKSRTTIR